jgi:hypothetical protein
MNKKEMAAKLATKIGVSQVKAMEILLRHTGVSSESAE